MTIAEIVAAIRSLPIPERLRVIELAARDLANDLSSGAAEPAPGVGVTLVERNGFLVAHSESGAILPGEAFDHRPPANLQPPRPL